MRRLHDAATDWQPPPDAIFGAIPGTPPAGVRPLFDVPELVSHQDYCAGNVVFREGLPAAFIDFDLARPTTRVADIVNALRVDVVPTAVRRAANSTLTMHAAAQVDPVFRRWWEAGLNVSLPRAETWLAEHADRMQDRLLQETGPAPAYGRSRT